MHALATETAFDPTIYDLPIPTIDGHKADKLAIILTGRIDLDRTNRNHLDLINQLELGNTVHLACDATVTGKPATYKPGKDDTAATTTIQTTLRITHATIT